MKFKIRFNDSTSSLHLYAVKKLFANLQGVEVISNTPDSYIIEALGEDAVRIIEDMSLFSYIISERL